MSDKVKGICRLCGNESVEWMSTMFRVMKCGSCAFIGSDKAESDIAEFYKSYGWNSEFKDQPQIDIEIKMLKPYSLLEIGCNSGTFLEKARDSFKMDVYGVDASDDVAANARSKGLNVLSGYFRKGIFSRKFDNVVARHMLEHVLDLRGFAEAVRDVLPIGGKLIIEVPDFEFYMRKRDYSCFWDQHVNYFTEKTLRDFFHMCGVTVSDVKRFDFSGKSIMMVGERAHGDSDNLLINEYAAAYEGFIDESRKIINDVSSTKKIGVYGAGCRSMNMINMLGIKNNISHVFDDHAYKIGKEFCGKITELPNPEAVDICFLGVNEENEAKILSKHKFKHPISFFGDFRPKLKEIKETKEILAN